MSESSSGKHRRLLVVPRDVSGLYPVPHFKAPPRERTRRFALDAGLESKRDRRPLDDVTPSPRHLERTLLFVAPLADGAREPERMPISDADIVDDDPTPRDEDMVQRADGALAALTERIRKVPSGEGTFVLPRAQRRRAARQAEEARHAHDAHDAQVAQQAQPARAAARRRAPTFARVRRWHVAILVGAALVLLAALLVPVAAPDVRADALERTRRARAQLELMELLDRDALAASVSPSPLDESLAHALAGNDDGNDDDVEPRVRSERRRARVARAERTPAASATVDDVAAPSTIVAKRAFDPDDAPRVAPVPVPVARSAAAPRADGFARVRTGAAFGGSQ